MSQLLHFIILTVPSHTAGEDKQFEESSEDIGDVTINIRELDDVLMKDVGNKILDSGKCVLKRTVSISELHSCSMFL